MRPNTLAYRYGFLAFRIYWTILETLLTRTTVIGKDKIPLDDERPLIFAINHASTYDPFVMYYHIPTFVRAVAAGDFRLPFMEGWLVENAQFIVIKRGQADHQSLREMVKALKDGSNLCIFPEGGTWEKRIDDVKPGVAYLSLMGNAIIVPVALGGTYQVWKRIWRFQRPRVTIEFLDPLPPVTVKNRSERQEVLEQTSQEIMEIIYDELPIAERERYDLHARQKFIGFVDLAPNIHDITTDENDWSTMAEVVTKANLFNPFYQNLGLPMRPFQELDRYHDADEFIIAIDELKNAVLNTVPNFLNYRLGDRKAHKGIREMDELRAIAEKAADKGMKMRFRTQVVVMDEPLPPNT